jgi:predicted molibdopterin-dependent oxidoreductase YjgC
MGCNIEIDTRLGSEVVRFMSRDNAGVDDSWLCDRGRYGYGFIQDENRLKTPLLRKNGKLEPASWADAFDFIVTKLKQIKSTIGSAALGGIASTHSTNEELFLFQLFMRQVLGTNNIDHQHGNFSNTEWGAISWLHIATIAGLEQANLIVLTLADPSARQPVLELRIKKALRKGAKLVIIGPETPADSKPNPLERFATQVVKIQPEHVAEALNNLLAALVTDGTAKGLQDATIKDYLSQVSAEHKPVASLGSEQLAKVVQLLASSERISFLYDEIATLLPGSENLLDALVKLAIATDQLSQPENGIGMLVSANNSVGARDMGVLPDYLPGYQPVKDQSQPGLNYPAMLSAGGVKGLLVLGEDAIKVTPENKAALQALELLVVSELALSEAGQLAHVVLPAASFAEKDGTFTNWEGRVQKINAAIPPMQGCAPEAAILLELATRLGQPFALRGPGDIFAEAVKATPLYAGLSYTRIGTQGAFRNYIQPTSGESTNNNALKWLKERAAEQQASGGVA